MENYVRYSLWGAPTRMKSSVIPHIFDCQPDRRTTASSTLRPGYVKLNRKRTIDKILSENRLENSIKKSGTVGTLQAHHDAVNSNKPRSDVNATTTRVPMQDLDVNTEHPQKVTSACETVPVGQLALQNYDESSASCFTSAHNIENVSSPTKSNENRKIINHKQIQCKILSPKHRRSKAIGCNISKEFEVHVGTNTENQVKVRTTEVGCSPIWKWPRSSSSSALTSVSKLGSYPISSGSEYKISDLDEMIAEDEYESKRLQRVITNYNIANDPMFYLRIPHNWIWILEEISLQTSVPIDYIKLTLMKIKLDDQFKRLGDQFGYGAAHTARIFNITIPKLHECVKTFMYVPRPEQVQKLLPVPFRTHFSKVYAIVDCLEIQIEKPSNSLHQALT